MGNFIKPTDGKVQYCFLTSTKGEYDITGYVHCVRIYEIVM